MCACRWGRVDVCAEAGGVDVCVGAGHTDL